MVKSLAISGQLPTNTHITLNKWTAICCGDVLLLVNRALQAVTVNGILHLPLQCILYRVDSTVAVVGHVHCNESKRFNNYNNAAYVMKL